MWAGIQVGQSNKHVTPNVYQNRIMAEYQPGVRGRTAISWVTIFDTTSEQTVAIQHDKPLVPSAYLIKSEVTKGRRPKRPCLDMTINGHAFKKGDCSPADCQSACKRNPLVGGAIGRC